MDSRRQALWAAMGMVEWQVTRGELLACQGPLPTESHDEAVRDAAVEAVVAPLPMLWWSGVCPSWLSDLLPILGLTTEACHPLVEVEPDALPLDMVLLLPGASEQAMTVACQHRFDARGGKRALWQQLCEAGVVDDSRWEEA